MIKGTSKEEKSLGESPENKMIKFGKEGKKEPNPKEKTVDLTIKGEQKKENNKKA